MRGSTGVVTDPSGLVTNRTPKLGENVCANPLSSDESYRANQRNSTIAPTHVKAALARPSGIHHRAAKETIA